MPKKFIWSEVDFGDNCITKEMGYYAYYGREELGCIDFYKPWKKFVWNQNEDIVMSLSCMENVVKKLKELTFQNRENQELCKCGHHTNDHSYDPMRKDDNLYCDICDCKEFNLRELCECEFGATSGKKTYECDRCKKLEQDAPKDLRDLGKGTTDEDKIEKEINKDYEN